VQYLLSIEHLFESRISYPSCQTNKSLKINKDKQASPLPEAKQIIEDDTSFPLP
jgi:hypothetical protein